MNPIKLFVWFTFVLGIVVMVDHDFRLAAAVIMFVLSSRLLDRMDVPQGIPLELTPEEKAKMDKIVKGIVKRKGLE